MKIETLKACDLFLGRLLCHCFPVVRRTCPEDAPSASILLIRPGGIGDAVLLIPSLLALKAQYPHAEITILAERRNAAVFTLCPQIDHLLLYDSPSGFLKAIKGNFDLVIDTEQWHRLSAVVTRLINAPVSIGYATNERSRLFTHPVAYSQEEYEMESFFHLLAPLGMHESETPERFLALPATAATNALRLLEPVGEKKFVTIFPGASIPERRWGADRFRSVAELLAAFGIAVVVVGGKEDREQGDMIVAGGTGFNLAGRTSLAETAAIIDRSALLVSGDSGVLHIAVGLGKPTVSLFGPGRARNWAPRGSIHTVINKGLSCSPCTTFGTTPRCPTNADCMKKIGVDEVFNAVAVLLTATGVFPSSCCKRDWIEVA